MSLQNISRIPAPRSSLFEPEYQERLKPLIIERLRGPQLRVPNPPPGFQPFGARTSILGVGFVMIQGLIAGGELAVLSAFAER